LLTLLDVEDGTEMEVVVLVVVDGVLNIRYDAPKPIARITTNPTKRINL